MGLSAEQIKAGLDAVAVLEPGIARALERAGYPEPRIRPTGYSTMMTAFHALLYPHRAITGMF